MENGKSLDKRSLVAFQEGRISWKDVVGEKSPLIKESEHVAEDLARSLMVPLRRHFPRGVSIILVSPHHSSVKADVDGRKRTEERRSFGVKLEGVVVEPRGSSTGEGRFFIGFIPRLFEVEDGSLVPVYDRLSVAKIVSHRDGKWLSDAYNNGFDLKGVNPNGRISPFDFPEEVKKVHGIKGESILRPYLEWQKSLVANPDARRSLIDNIGLMISAS